jgi:hypothetical protein
MTFARRFVVTLTLLAIAAPLGGCGSKSDLSGKRPRGPRPDAGVEDLGVPDGGDPDLGPSFLEVECGRRERYTSPRREIALSAQVNASAVLASQEWTVVSTPATSMPRITPADAVVGVEPDMEGDYALHFEVRDVNGLSASCDVVVHSIVGPPAAICPEDPLTTAPNVPVMVIGDGYDDVRVVSYAWRLDTSPAGSSPRIDPTDLPVTTFVADLVGDYTLELTVADADGGTGSCIARVLVNGGPTVECPSSPISAPTRRPLTLTATAVDDGGPVTSRWETITRPPTSMATNTPTSGLSTVITPDRVGDYLLRFTATDADGLESRGHGERDPDTAGSDLPAAARDDAALHRVDHRQRSRRWIRHVVPLDDAVAARRLLVDATRARGHGDDALHAGPRRRLHAAVHRHRQRWSDRHLRDHRARARRRRPARRALLEPAGSLVPHDVAARLRLHRRRLPPAASERDALVR